MSDQYRVRVPDNEEEEEEPKAIYPAAALFACVSVSVTVHVSAYVTVYCFLDRGKCTTAARTLVYVPAR